MVFDEFRSIWECFGFAGVSIKALKREREIIHWIERNNCCSSYTFGIHNSYFLTIADIGGFTYACARQEKLTCGAVFLNNRKIRFC